MLNGINGLAGTPATNAADNSASLAPAASGSTKILYGDAKSAKQLTDMLDILKQFSSTAQQTVRTGNPTLE